MITLQGKGVSSGIAGGMLVFLKRRSLSVEKQPVDDVEKELECFEAARRVASDQLDELSKEMAGKIGEENAVLFEIHRMLLEDIDYTGPIIDIIKNEKVCAEYAVNTAGSRLAQEFAGMDDEYMQARSVDVYDVSKRVIGILCGADTDLTRHDEPVILASDDCRNIHGTGKNRRVGIGRALPGHQSQYLAAAKLGSFAGIETRGGGMESRVISF